MNYFKLYEVHSPEKNLRYLTSKLTKKKKNSRIGLYQNHRFQHLKKKSNKRFSKQVFMYIPNGKRQLAHYEEVTKKNNRSNQMCYMVVKHGLLY